MHRRAPLALSVLGLILTGYGAWLGAGHVACFEHAASLLLASIGVLSIAAASGGKLRLQRGLAMLLLGLNLILAGDSLLGTEIFSLDLFGDPRYAGFLLGLLTLNIVGLWRGIFLARWLAIALAGGGILSSVLNLVPFALEQSGFTWVLGTSLGGAVLVLANLVGPQQREHFEKNASPLWSSPDPMLRSIRLTMMTFMAAVPMLLVYAWLQPIVPETAEAALPLAAFLGLTVIASAKRMVIGALGLVIGGVALLVQTGVTVALAYQMPHPVFADISLYYALFWVPAGLSALGCGVRMAAPLLRLLRE